MLFMITLYKNLYGIVILRGHLFFSKNYFTIDTNFYWTLKIEEILNLTLFVLFSSFCNYGILGGLNWNISETIFLELIFHLKLSYQLPDALLQEVCRHLTCLINHCI